MAARLGLGRANGRVGGERRKDAAGLREARRSSGWLLASAFAGGTGAILEREE
ncbi:Hypothetical predicted protein [Podarcis lilfordi]|uniref:Uncharacterized protein n=1 Tax=Podarcis lilfordi TaxID=74358 RepID=A0AA35KRS5_9SAUR|nr:Hypothetical predicted protein [Podarcis lilfordi]